MLRGSRSFLAIVVGLSFLPIVFLYWKGLPAFLGKHATLRESLNALPHALLGILAFLGARMQQHRILFAALLVALAYSLASSPDTLSRAVPMTTRSALLLVTAPLSLLVLAFLKPGRLWSRYGGFHLAAVLAPLLVGVALSAWAPSFARRALLGQAVPWPRGWGWRAPDLALVFAVAFSASAFQLRDRYFREFHLAASICLVPLFWLFSKLAPTPLQTTIVFCGVSLALLYAMYRLYWRKVYIDELTGIPNRRALEEKLLQLDKHYLIAMGDIDHFKKFNDAYGHDEGDNVLRFVAAHLDEETGSRVFRYGGEEFCVVIEDLAADEAEELLDRARERLASRDFYIRAVEKNRDRKKRYRVAEADKVKTRVTISIGLAARSGKSPTPIQVIQAADELLYKAKERGRNRLVTER